MTRNDQLDMKDKSEVLRIFLRTVTFLVILLVIYVIVFLVNQRYGEFIYADDRGTVDMSEWSFEQDGREYLEHGWQFYPSEFLRPDDFSENESDKKNGEYFRKLSIPHYDNVSISNTGWTYLGLNARPHNSPQRMSNYGYGTYRTVIRLPEKTHTVALDFPEINYASEIYANGVLVAEIGSVGDDSNYQFEEAYTNIRVLVDEEEYLDLIIICANYTSPFGGITIPPGIGTPTQIDTIATASKIWISSLVTLSALIITAGFFVSSTFRARQKYLYFALIIAISLCYEFSDKIFNPLSGEWNKLLQTTFFLLLMLVATLYFSSLYPRNEEDLFGRIKNADIMIISLIVIIFLSLYWLAPDLLYRKSTIVANTLFAAVINLYNFFKVLYKTPRHPEEGTFHLVAAAMASIIFSTMLIRSPQVYFIPLHSFGIMILIFGTALYFTIRYVQNFKRTSRFSQEMELAVQEKTRSIARVNAELVNANQMLMHNEEARKKMMSNVSHDLRTPITAIRGYIELIMNSKQNIPQEKISAYLSNMHTRSVQMEQLIDDMVQLTRLESDTSQTDIQTVNLKDMIENLYDLYVMECENTSKYIELNLPQNDKLTVMADPNRILRVFENIIVNALRYTDESGHIEINAYREMGAVGQENIHIEVSDNGIGIPPDELPYIFDRFYRAANAAVNKSGSGLGLSIVKSIVEKHSGQIWADSVSGKGSTFHVVLPAAPKNRVRKKIEKKPETPSSETSGSI